MRPVRLFAFVALLGTVAAVLGACAAPQALAASSKVRLEVNQNCVEPAWPCWTDEASSLKPQPASVVTITEDGEVEFVDHDASTAASVNWVGSGTAPACTGVPTTATMDWEGKCTFATPGTYRFESATMFEDAYENYKKYEIIVGGAPKAKTTPTSTEHQTEATLTGSIEPEGSPVEYHFEYGSGSVSEHSSTPTSLGATDFTSHSVSLPVSGLLAGTEYHFELIVSYDDNKTVAGGPLTFTTPPTKPTKEPPAKEPPAKEPPAKEPSPTPTPSSGNPTATTSSSPSSGQPEAEPAFSPLFESVKLASTQHSSSVRGTVDISQAGGGGRLEVTLLATATSLAKAGHSSKVRVGRFLRSSLQAGVVSFTVPLTAKAKSALRAHKRLALTVQIVLTPTHGAAVTVTKSVVLHG
jgi:hypothetical protein